MHQLREGGELSVGILDIQNRVDKILCEVWSTVAGGRRSRRQWEWRRGTGGVKVLEMAVQYLKVL